MQKTEYEKMLDGELYDANDAVLKQMRLKARILMQEYNQSPYDKQQREILLKKLLSLLQADHSGEKPWTTLQA